MPPAEATLEAMRQITGPIIAITLVLLSVFVPVGFIPGLSGTLFRQFAVTISCAMLISAMNALTLSPALCAVFLRHSGERRRPLGRLLNGIDTCATAMRGWCSASCALPCCRCWRSRRAVRRLFPVGTHTPTGFLPEEDQGAFFIADRNCRTARRSRAAPRWRRGWSKSAARHAADPGHAVDHRLLAAGRRRV